MQLKLTKTALYSRIDTLCSYVHISNLCDLKKISVCYSSGAIFTKSIVSQFNINAA